MNTDKIKFWDNPHDLIHVNHIRVQYGTLVVSFNRNDNLINIDISSNGYSLHIDDNGEISHFLTKQSKLDLERLLRNYSNYRKGITDDELIFYGDKFLNKFEKNIIISY